MKQNDGRRNNDNSRVYHIERIEKIKEAIEDVCNKVKLRGEPRTFAHVAIVMKNHYKKPILVSAQTLRENSEYRRIFERLLKDDIDEFAEVKIRKNNPKSSAELRHELHKEKMKLAKLRSDIKILKHQIKQAGVEASNNAYDTIDINTLEQLTMSNTTLLQMMYELSKLGDFFWDREGFKRASDGKLFLTQKAMLIMGIEPKKLLEYFPKKNS